MDVDNFMDRFIPSAFAVLQLCIFSYFTTTRSSASSSIEACQDYGVFYSFDAVMQVFNDAKYYNTTEVRQLMRTYQETYPYDPRRRYGKRKPFIVVESTRRDSRRSVGWMLARSTGSRYMSNPPRSLVPLRDMFDNRGGLLRRAYFSIGMYAAAHDVLEVMYRYPVVMAGYWHDQASFAIAKEFDSIDDLPLPSSEVYRWPSDLLKPDLVFYINSPDREAGNWRGTPKPNMFKPILVEVMRRMYGMPIVELNDTYLYDDILIKMQTHLDTYLPGRLNFQQVFYKDIIGHGGQDEQEE